KEKKQEEASFDLKVIEQQYESYKSLSEQTNGAIEKNFNAKILSITEKSLLEGIEYVVQKPKKATNQRTNEKPKKGPVLQHVRFHDLLYTLLDDTLRALVDIYSNIDEVRVYYGNFN